MINDFYKSVKRNYVTGKDNLAEDFFLPCLNQANLYRRAAGYFSSSAMLTWSNALTRIASSSGLKVQLIVSPELSESDINAFRILTNENQRKEQRKILVDKIFDKILLMIETPTDLDLRTQIFCWLVANERIEFRFAFPTHQEQVGIFHEKYGIFDFDTDHQLAFIGSANETLGGHKLNFESIDVYRNWVEGEQIRVMDKIEQFEDAWNGRISGLLIEQPSNRIINKLISRAPRLYPTKENHNKINEQIDIRWKHQTEAVDHFIQKKHGILEMATGTGKTRTSLKILEKLIDGDEINGAIITMDGTDLLRQWSIEVDSWMLSKDYNWRVYKYFDKYNQSNSFILDPFKSILVVSREQLPKVLKRNELESHKSKMIIIHDEVHGLGMPSLVNSIKGKHKGFGWRLGLSATPERAYDQEGNEFIESELGKTIYSFPLELAIERGTLTEFDYIPLEYHLTENDQTRLKAVRAQKKSRELEGNPMSQEEFWTKLAQVYKTAEMKPIVFKDFLETNPQILKRTIIFVDNMEYGNSLLEIIHRHTTNYHTYYSGDDQDHLIQFANGNTDCLVTCHRISQGIDINSLENVVLFASNRARLETIQRIGRCLRLDPTNVDKKAKVIDFVRPSTNGETSPNSDQDRFAWLSELAKTRKLEHG